MAAQYPQEETTQQRLKVILKDVLGGEYSDYNDPAQELAKDLGMTDINSKDIADNIGDEFEIDCTEEDVETAFSLGKLIALIDQRLKMNLEINAS